MTFNKEGIIKSITGSINIIFTLGGVLSIGYGSYLVYEPSAFIVVGLIFFWMGIPDKK